MVGGLGLAGAASAAVIAPPASGAATALRLAPEGIGHILMVPYYTAQGGNATFLNIVNTDETNGKVAKVRFRGASNSDDVFDFLLFLSPGDVWTGMVTKDAASGLANLSTPDNSCVLPKEIKAVGGNKFITTRLDKKSFNGMAAETREGYVEVLNTADLVDGSSMYKTTKHDANGNVVCDPAKLDIYFDQKESPLAGKEFMTVSEAASVGLSFPTGGLFANWTILNLNDAAAWGGAAAAVTAESSVGVAAKGNMVLFNQSVGDVTGATNIATGGVGRGTGADLTADPLMKAAATSATGGLVKLQHYDLPDLSTPYLAATTVAAAQAENLTTQLSKTFIKNEYIVSDSVNASTDWVFSMPTRRYAAAVNYGTGNNGAASVVFNTVNNKYFNAANTKLPSSPAKFVRVACVDVGSTFTYYDRSEQKPDDEGGLVISPDQPGEQEVVDFCGEAGVWSIGAGDDVAGSSLHAAITRKNIEVDGFQDGWASITTANGGNGLPILGDAFLKVQNGAMSYGANWPHRYAAGLKTPVAPTAP